MPNSDSQNVDKNIVDRTQRKPNEAVMNAVKDKREQLQHGGSITKSYAREMIVFHTNSVLEGAAIGPLLVIATAGMSYYLQHSVQMMIWAILASLSYTVLTIVAQKAAKISPT